MVTEVIFDLETQKFFDEIGEFDPSKLGVSIVSVYKRKLDDSFGEIEGKIQSFWEEDLPKMWEVFADVQRIIGFNSKRFDIPALKSYAPEVFAKLPHFDLLEQVRVAHGRRVSLNSIAAETLGRGKSDNPANAGKYWKKHDPESLEKLRHYCEEDVYLTRDVYDFGLKNKFLRFKDYWNTIREVEVDFSYPLAENEVKEQIELL